MAKVVLTRDRGHIGSTSARTQALTAFVVGVVTGVVVGVTTTAPLGVLIGFDVAAAVYVVRIWLTIWPLDATDTARLAAREDPTRGLADVVVLVAAVAALAAVGVVIAKAKSTHGAAEAARIALGVGSVVIAWTLVHTIYTLKYARLYFSDGVGGVNFKTQVPPPYTDFAYLAFTLGMTFQVSDTDLQHPDFRRLALGHALLSYVFGTVIVAAAINLVAGLAG